MLFSISAVHYENYSPEEAPYEKLKKEEIDVNKNKEYAEVQISQINVTLQTHLVCLLSLFTYHYIVDIWINCKICMHADHKTPSPPTNCL